VEPELSVIIPARNEERHIGMILADLLDQDLDPALYEILVVDGLSEDRTADLVTDLARHHPQLQLFQNPALLSSAARNIGARRARGRYLLYVDGHCRIPERQLLRKTLEAFRAGDCCLSRPQSFLTAGVTPFQKAAALARNSPFGHHAGSQIYSASSRECNPVSAGCGYTRELVLALGGFDESFDACEDLEFNWRVWRSGVMARHDPSFNVRYYPRGGVRALFRQLFRYGFGRARMLAKHPGAFSLPSCGLAGGCLLIAGLPLLGLLWQPLWWVWLFLALLYLAVVLAMSVLGAGQAEMKLLPLILASFVAIHAGAGLGFLSGLVGGPSGAHKRAGGEQASATLSEAPEPRQQPAEGTTTNRF